MILEWQDIWAGIALLLVFEGMMPFLSPDGWRKMILIISQQSDRQLRRMGLISMLLGASILYFSITPAI